MRSLTGKQKKLLNDWYTKQKENGVTLGLWWDVQHDENFPSELYETIDAINPCEVFYQNVNRYIQDKAMTG